MEDAPPIAREEDACTGSLPRETQTPGVAPFLSNNEDSPSRTVSDNASHGHSACESSSSLYTDTTELQDPLSATSFPQTYPASACWCYFTKLRAAQLRVVCGVCLLAVAGMLLCIAAVAALSLYGGYDVTEAKVGQFLSSRVTPIVTHITHHSIFAGGASLLNIIAAITAVGVTGALAVGIGLVTFQRQRRSHGSECIYSENPHASYGSLIAAISRFRWFLRSPLFLSGGRYQRSGNNCIIGDVDNSSSSSSNGTGQPTESTDIFNSPLNREDSVSNRSDGNTLNTLSNNVGPFTAAAIHLRDKEGGGASIGPQLHSSNEGGQAGIYAAASDADAAVGGGAGKGDDCNSGVYYRRRGAPTSSSSKPSVEVIRQRRGFRHSLQYFPPWWRAPFHRLKEVFRTFFHIVTAKFRVPIETSERRGSSTTQTAAREATPTSTARATARTEAIQAPLFPFTSDLPDITQTQVAVEPEANVHAKTTLLSQASRECRRTQTATAAVAAGGSSAATPGSTQSASHEEETGERQVCREHEEEVSCGSIPAATDFISGGSTEAGAQEATESKDVQSPPTLHNVDRGSKTEELSSETKGAADHNVSNIQCDERWSSGYTGVTSTTKEEQAICSRMRQQETCSCPAGRGRPIESSNASPMSGKKEGGEEERNRGSSCIPLLREKVRQSRRFFGVGGGAAAGAAAARRGDSESSGGSVQAESETEGWLVVQEAEGRRKCT